MLSKTILRLSGVAILSALAIGYFMSSSMARPRQLSVVQHLNGTSDSWHSQISINGLFRPEFDRYHMYIGLFCPFAHRANLVRHLKGLTDVIPISVVRAYPKGDERGWPGWKFPTDDKEYPGATPDHLFGSEYLHDVYFKADPEYKGRYSVPLLWDEKTDTIVNNESIELMRNLQTAFNDLIEDESLRDLNFYPESLQSQIDTISGWLQAKLNTGVYRAGFADGQSDYDANVIPVFAALNKIEKIIASNKGPFVLGKQLTEVDLLLYPTIIRFDTIYVQHFKANLGTIRHDYPQINNWMKGLYWGQAEMEGGRKVWGFGSETVNFMHIKENYSKSHHDINPKAITPRGPFPDVEQGYEQDFSKVRVGAIEMEEVVRQEKELQS